MALVMVIEDEEALALLLKYNLEKEGYEVIWEPRGNKALAEIEKHCPSVILLDWMLPEISGVEICKLIRSKPDIKNIPVIMLTAKGEEEDKIKGLSAGADDYVTKPFSVPELMARVKTNLRRAPELIRHKEFVFEDIRMDLVEKKVFRGDNYIHLGPTEFRLLRMLMEKKLPTTLRMLVDAAWSAESGIAGIEDRRAELLEFFGDRLRVMLRDKGYSAQEVDAVLALHPEKLDELPERLAAVRAFSALPAAAALAAANKRIGNILKKVDGEVSTDVDEALLNEQSEKALWAAMLVIEPQSMALFESGRYEAMLVSLAALREPVDRFFEDVMVNAEDPALRRNRQSLLKRLFILMNRVAEISRLA